VAVGRATIIAFVITRRGRTISFDRLSEIGGEGVGGGDLSVEEDQRKKK
jgi:hypothetical protein